MSSRSRAVRALLLTCAVSLVLLPCGAARADLGSKADKVSGTAPSIGKSIPVTAIGDDPDPVPTAAISYAGHGGPARAGSPDEGWRYRLSLILSAITGFPPMAPAPRPEASTASPASAECRRSAWSGPVPFRCTP